MKVLLYHRVEIRKHRSISGETETMVDTGTRCFAACSDRACRPFGPVQPPSKKPGTADTGVPVSVVLSHRHHINPEEIV